MIDMEMRIIKPWDINVFVELSWYVAAIFPGLKYNQKKRFI